ncbi:MAG: AbrB/MazE/SpoVT family DNA-binding domain-containing protein [Geminicoccaceae bacterium]
MSAARVRVDKAGRVLIPARSCRQMGLAPGDAVILEVREGGLQVRPYKRAIEEAQAIIRKYVPDPTRSLADELIEERRREVARE